MTIIHTLEKRVAALSEEHNAEMQSNPQKVNTHAQSCMIKR